MSALVAAGILSLIGSVQCATGILGGLRALVLPGVSLPPKSILPNSDLIANLKSVTVISSADLIKFGLTAKPISDKLKGKLKVNNGEGVLTQLHNYYVDAVLEHKELLPSDYQYFGTGSNVESLQLLLANNPFYASALSSSGGGFSVKTVDTGKGEKTWYYKLVSILEDTYPRINANFDSKMQLTSWEEVDINGKKIKSTKTKEEAAGDLLYTLTYYGECVHALIHVFHYMNVVAIGEAAKVYDMLTLWATPYIANVALKYEEVEAVLLGSNGGILTGGKNGAWRASNALDVQLVLKEMLTKWGSCKTANQFIDEFLFATMPKGTARKAGLLPEFFKHADLVGPFAKELSGAFANYDKVKYSLANDRIETCLSSGGGVSKIADIANWIELMSITGIVHGSTLSLSRLLITEEMLKRCSLGDKYTAVDCDLCFTAAGTIVGMIEDRHVFSASLSAETASSNAAKLPSSIPAIIATLFNPAELVKLAVNLKAIAKRTPALDPLAKEVLLKYDSKSAEIKKKFYDKLSKDKKFLTQGWILSDHFPDGVDGKQLTITTYI